MLTPEEIARYKKITPPAAMVEEIATWFEVEDFHHNSELTAKVYCFIMINEDKYGAPVKLRGTDIADYYQVHDTVIFPCLKHLEAKDWIKIDRSRQPYKYSINKKFES